MTQTSPHTDDGLAARWAALRSTSPHLRARDAARTLGVSEAALVASSDGVVRLGDDWATLVEALPTLGEVMALTRNEAVVSEIIGRYETVEINRAMQMGQVVGHPIDLRLFLRRWRFGFALHETVRGETRRSLQFFDAHGDAVHKVFLRSGGDVAAFDALCATHRHTSPEAALEFAPKPVPDAPRPDADIDVAGLLAAWDAMEDTHEFFGLLRRFGVGRLQALRLVGPSRADRLVHDDLRTLLEAARDGAVPIMVFVGNGAVLQIRSGVPRRVQVVGDWINVLDPDFNLHAHAPQLVEAWRVRKPSHGRFVTSVELYDAAGDNVALLFGQREDGAWDAPGWAALAGGLR